MLRRRNIAALLASAAGLVLAFPADAWAYIDPGTGSYLFQLTAAGLLAGIYAFRRYWDAVKARVLGGRADSSGDRPAGPGT